MKRIQYLCLVLICHFNSSAQVSVGSGPVGQFNNYNPLPASPNVAAFQKYGDMPVNVNTGLPQIEIPVYTIALNGFSWPISISYHASGYKTGDVATRVGLGWVLNAGGLISSKQSLFGTAPRMDIQRELDLGSYYNSQDIATCHYNNTSDIAIAESILNGAASVGPDFYYINAGRVNGKFIDAGANSCMLPASDNKIEPLGIYMGSYTGWKVTDDDGNVYEFLDKGQTGNSVDCQGMNNYTVTPSYFLSKITTNKGETLIFNYDIETYTYSQPALHVVKTTPQGQLNGCFSVTSPENYDCPTSSTVTEQRLLKITSSTGVEVYFSHSGRTDIPSSSKVERITISDVRNFIPKTIKAIDLSYEYFGTGTDPNNLQLKLKTIGQQEIGSTFSQAYKFSYNNTPLGSKITSSFWDGLFAISTAGVLEKIQYPTGGSTIFSYEALPTCGTLRITDIKDFGINNVATGYRKFEYGPPSMGAYPGTEYESVNYFGDLWTGAPFPGGCSPQEASNVEANIITCTRYIQKSTPVKNTILDLMGDTPRYADVTEFFGSNGENGKTVYHYGGIGRNAADLYYLGSPELLKEKSIYKKKSDGSYAIVSKTLNEYAVPNAAGDFFSNYTGSLKEQRFWIKTVSKIREELTYSCNQSFPYTKCFPKTYIEQNYRIASVPLYLSKTTEETYSGIDKISNVMSYFYENPLHLKPTKIEFKNSKGETIRTTNKYPYDFSSTSVYADMITKNRVSPVIEQIQTNVTRSQEIKHEKINYQYFSSTMIEPVTTQLSYLGAPLAVEATIADYTSNGNPLQVTGKDGITTSFVYGYNMQYPVAKVVGVTYNNVVNLSGANLSVIGNPVDDNAIRFELNKIRAISGALVSSYTYKPFIGVNSETDINNKTRYYSYDGFNRLSFVKDNDNNILKKICYNFYGQIEDCSGQSTTPVWQGLDITRCKVCPTNAAYYTGIIQMQEKDINPSSGTYNSTRWVDYSYDNSSCFLQSDWVTDNTVPVFCSKTNGQNNGYQARLQRNMNPCSPNYLQTRETSLPLNCSVCPKPPVWQNWGNQECEIINGSYTGNLTRGEINLTDCSSIPYGTTRRVFDSYNPTLCSASACNPNNCVGDGYKCINNSCEAGVKVYTSSYMIDEINWIYSCGYHYEFSDGSWSGTFQEMSYVPCL